MMWQVVFFKEGEITFDADDNLVRKMDIIEAFEEYFLGSPPMQLRKVAQGPELWTVDPEPVMSMPKYEKFERVRVQPREVELQESRVYYRLVS